MTKWPANYSLFVSNIGKWTIEPDHVAGEKVELILLELLLHLFELIRLHFHSFAHLAGLARVLTHDGRRSPLFQLRRAICFRYAFEFVVAAAVDVIKIRVNLLVVDNRIFVNLMLIAFQSVGRWLFFYYCEWEKKRSGEVGWGSKACSPIYTCKRLLSLFTEWKVKESFERKNTTRENFPNTIRFCRSAPTNRNWNSNMVLSERYALLMLIELSVLQWKKKRGSGGTSSSWSLSLALFANCAYKSQSCLN